MAELKYTGDPLFEESDVDPPGLHDLPSPYVSTEGAYDLALYRESGSSNRGVLRVRIVLQFEFAKGPDGDKWESDEEKEKFAYDFVCACHERWNDRFRLKLSKKAKDRREITDVGVQFYIEKRVDTVSISDHWELKVLKVSAHRSSGVKQHEKTGTMDSMDNVGRDKSDGKGKYIQRGAVHEFGHMLGLKDEYPAERGTPHYTSDYDSIMNGAETVRARHYAPFAHWLSVNYEDHVGYPSGVQNGQGIRFAVIDTDGSEVDLSNAKLT